MSERPWYYEGLRFGCKGCGECCSGEPGYIWVNEAEIHALAAALGIAPEDFEGKYVRNEGRRRTLKERADGDCVLQDAVTRRCLAYAVRPRQCRSWPFWPSNLRTPEAWQQTCKDCPGAGKGRLVELVEIEESRGMIQI
ncbi:MAG TPA: YkgJ family cysteine cluster protein [Thermoguttaceae bacterium]|nr:YkgJ family cysteine cluster protein [Thermoguttaceae bacterium]